MIQMNLFTKQKETHKLGRASLRWPKGITVVGAGGQLPRGTEGEGLKVGDWCVHTAIYKIGKQQEFAM